MTVVIFLLIAAYLIGSIPCGILVSKFLGTPDPRLQGSGNIGATNISRIGGKKAGVVTLIGDALKGAAPALAGIWLAPETPYIAGLAGLAAFLGHLYPIFLGFKGGKGIATALGIFLILTPWAIAIEIILFSVIMLTVRIVSVGSLAAALTIPVCICLLSYPKAYVLSALVIAILTIYKHRENLKRLVAGQEPKFF
ncbi:MAG: glycerol-3-phosphate 1-O-acyltransferase PlsY [Pseudomonadota bacterium]|nr:glycerol-3-phosphate 1-O-acyltransferase PlsY [Pseudomonadota bacterium]